MTKAKYFSERPYSDGTKSYKFSSANILRLLSSDNEIIRKGDPRWLCIDEIKNNGWTVREEAKPELLEVWNIDGEQECSLTEFYNVADILGRKAFKVEEKTLESVLEFLQERGLLEYDSETISFDNGIEAIKNYAKKLGANELTGILTIQTWVTQSKLKTRLNWFLPTYSETILEGIENSPDMFFEAMSKAQAILKQLHREEIMTVAEDITEEPFGNLKIIYHGSETDLRDKSRVTYPKEAILRGSVAYDFLCSLKSSEVSKIWLEIFYKDYVHGKILLSGEDFEFVDDESISTF